MRHIAFLCAFISRCPPAALAPALSQMEIGFEPMCASGWQCYGSPGVRTCVRENVRARECACVSACVVSACERSDSRVTIRITVRPALFRPSSSTTSPFEPSSLWKVDAATRSNGTNTMPYTIVIQTAGPPSRWSRRVLVLHRVKALRDTWLYVDF